jgi:hypothetical protein
MIIRFTLSWTEKGKKTLCHYFQLPHNSIAKSYHHNHHLLTTSDLHGSGNIRPRTGKKLHFLQVYQGLRTSFQDVFKTGINISRPFKNQTDMNTMASPQISHDQAVLFLDDLKRQLNFHSTQKTVSLLRTVLSKFKGSFTGQQIRDIVTKTPSILHVLLVNHGRPEDQPGEIGHLDELVDTLYEEDQTAGRGLFKTEIEALGLVTVVLRKIEKLFKQAGIYAFNYTLTHELQQAAQEESV